MKGNVYIVILLLLFVISCKETGGKTIKTLSIQSNEKVNLYEDLEGNFIRLTDYKGKKIVLNFWATTCQPCINEMPSLLNVCSILKNDNYVFLFASDESPEEIKSFKRTHNFNFNFIRFMGSLASMKIYALPKTFIYNTKGEVVDEITGSIQWDSEQIINKLKNIK